MNKLFLALAFLIIVPSLALAAGKKVACTEMSLRSSYLQKQQQGQNVTHLQQKSWWKNCPLDVRKAVFSGLFAPTATSSSSMQKKSDLPILGKAPEFQGLGTWLNSPPLTMAGLKGKVVLIDFWTYSCINCIRTQPFVAKYWDTYKDKPFVIIGVHTPEFTFEKSESNVRKAVKDAGMSYPVVQDNEFATWNAFSNRYWPAFYLIDAKGNIRYEHFGEGEYSAMDKAIHDLLGEIGG